MIFYVYFDPAVISVANENGPYAIQALIAFLRAVGQNCFVGDFKDGRNQETEIKEQVEALPEDFDRRTIKSLLSHLKKRNRFLYCFEPDYDGNLSDLEIVLDQAGAQMFDLLLVQSDAEVQPPEGVEVCSLVNYQHTDFERRRSQLAGEGRTFGNDEFDKDDFMDEVFKKALRWARRIEVCDRLFGTYFASPYERRSNYEYTAEVFLSWLGKTLVDPNLCKIIFHCGKPDGHTDDYMKTQLTLFRPDELANTVIEIQFYLAENQREVLPHERFLITDQIALSLDRGMDFLNQRTEKNRNTSLGYKSLDSVERILQSYFNGGTSTVVLSPPS